MDFQPESSTLAKKIVSALGTSGGSTEKLRKELKKFESINDNYKVKLELEKKEETDWDVDGYHPDDGIPDSRHYTSTYYFLVVYRSGSEVEKFWFARSQYNYEQNIVNKTPDEIIEALNEFVD